ncbi:MAG TPA: ribosome maturation factor RimM, partial [Yinghuangia sp.]|nr:ribosome maturation factor RimM [Yinghuangia sp.]
MQLVVARIGRAHGIRGQVSVEVRTDEPELRLAPGAVLMTDPPSAGPLTISAGKVHSGRLLLTFEGVGDRNAAEALRNVLLIAEVDPNEFPDDPEEFYDHQLVGLDAVLADGTLLGEVAEVAHLPAQDLLIVR